MNRAVPVNEPLLDGNEKKYITECIDSGWISSDGPFVRQFEQRMASAAGRKHGIAVSNGTVALELAIAALRLPPNSEIILPSFTIISCVAAILRNGCVPVLVDSDSVTWNMIPGQIEPKITSKTRAIMAVHTYGLPVDMEPILKLAEANNLIVIEDASEMIGQTYRSRPCGSFGELSTFSFYANKHVTTGEGGMVVTDDDEIAERCRSLRNLAFIPDKRFVHEELGYNYRMTNMQAALGFAQLEKLDRTVARKREMGEHYNRLLAGIEGIQLPLAATEDAENIYWVYGIVLNDELGADAREAMDRLARYGIGTRPFFWPMHEQPVLRRAGYFAGEKYPVAERLARKRFYIPSGAALSEEQRVAVAAGMEKVIEEIKRR